MIWGRTGTAARGVMGEGSLGRLLAKGFERERTRREVERETGAGRPTGRGRDF